MNSVPREVRLFTGDAHVADQRGVARILGFLRIHFASEAVDATQYKVILFSQYRRTDQSSGESVAEFFLLRRKAESKTEMDNGFPEQVATKLRMHSAAPSRCEQTPVIASSRRSLGFMGVAANLRRFSGSRGGGSRQDVLITEEAVGPLGSDEDQEACVAYKKVGKEGLGQKRKDGPPNVVRIK